MTDGPHRHQSRNKDLQRIQQDIQNQFVEKRTLQARAERLLKYVLMLFGAILLILAFITFVESRTVISVFSLKGIINLAEEATTETFLQQHHAELVLLVAVFGTFSFLTHAMYFVFVKFLPIAIELMSSSEMRSGVKPSRYAAIHGDDVNKKAEKLLLLDLISALEHNREIIENLQTQLDNSLRYLKKGITLLIGTFLTILAPLITQSSLGFVIGGTGASVVGILLLLDEVTLVNYTDLIVHDPKTDFAIVAAVVGTLILSTLPAAPLVIMGPLVAGVGLLHTAVLLFAIGVEFHERLAIATRTLIFILIVVVLLGAVQAALQDLPTAAYNTSLGVIGSLVFSTGSLLLISIIEALGRAGFPLAEFVISNLHSGDS